MASVSSDAKGWRIDFRTPDGTRRVLRCGTGGTRRQAEKLKTMLEALVAARAAGVPPDQSVSLWLGSLPDGRLRARLVEIGLAAERERDRPLVDWLEAHLRVRGERAAVTDSTRLVWARAVGHAREHFGRRLLSELRAEDGAGFRAALLRRPGRLGGSFAEATVRKSCGIVAMACRAARRAGLVACDPFEGVPTAAGANPERAVYVDLGTVRRVLEAAPVGDEFRLLVELSRFAGVRVPSEVRELRWSDVDWAEGSLRIVSPKTRRSGRPWRLVPIAPELLLRLERAFAEAAEGTEFVLPEYRRHSNPCVPLLRACRAAGVEPWPRPFHALRASCETDWAARFPLASVAQWLGHSPSVACSHYLRGRGEDFRAATRGGAPAGGDAGGDTGGDSDADPVVTRVVTRAAATARIGSHRTRQVPAARGVAAEKRDSPRVPATDREVRGECFSGPYRSRTSPHNSEQGNELRDVLPAGGDAGGDSGARCAELEAVARLWPRLSPTVRAAVRAMAEAAARG
jgi:integrase